MINIIAEVDVLVIGGGTAGPMAAVKAKEKNPAAKVMLLEKAHVKRSGAISMGMDGLNNAVIPGHATPEQYVNEITIANDGIVNQKTVMAYAQNSFDMINQLDRWGVKFEKHETGDYAVRKVHHMGTDECPVTAIYGEPDLPEEYSHYIALNAELTKSWPLTKEKGEPLADADQWADVKEKFQYQETAETV